MEIRFGLFVYKVFVVLVCMGAVFLFILCTSDGEIGERVHECCCILMGIEQFVSFKNKGYCLAMPAYDTIFSTP